MIFFTSIKSCPDPTDTGHFIAPIFGKYDLIHRPSLSMQCILILFFHFNIRNSFQMPLSSNTIMCIMCMHSVL